MTKVSGGLWEVVGLEYANRMPDAPQDRRNMERADALRHAVVAVYGEARAADPAVEFAIQAAASALDPRTCVTRAPRWTPADRRCESHPSLTCR